MEGKVNVFYGKGLFKSAVAVGAGFVVGKYVGSCVTVALDSVVQGLIEHRAEKESKTAQAICERLNLNLKHKKPDEDSSNKVIGFRYE